MNIYIYIVIYGFRILECFRCFRFRCIIHKKDSRGQFYLACPPLSVTPSAPPNMVSFVREGVGQDVNDANLEPVNFPADLCYLIGSSDL